MALAFLVCGIALRAEFRVRCEEGTCSVWERQSNGLQDGCLSTLPGGRCPSSGCGLWLLLLWVLCLGLTQEVQEPHEMMVQLLHQEQSPGSKEPFCSSVEAV